jgi:hypothetical protein
MKYEDALLIVCKVLTPYVTFDLLIDDKTPQKDAENIKIADLFHNLDLQDEKFGQNVVTFIVKQFHAKAEESGYKIALGKAELVNGMFKTIKALSTEIEETARPL